MLFRSRSSELWKKLRPPVDLKGFQSALAERDAAIHAWTMFLEATPIVIMPMCAEAALPLGLDTKEAASMERLFNAAGRFLFPLPVLGLPGLSMPLGTAKNGMPVGVQIVAGRYREDLCLDAGDIIEAHEGPRQPIDPNF